MVLLTGLILNVKSKKEQKKWLQLIEGKMFLDGVQEAKLTEHAEGEQCSHRVVGLQGDPDVSVDSVQRRVSERHG